MRSQGIIVPGTHWSRKDWNPQSDFYKRVANTFEESPIILQWSGGLSGGARTQGAPQLAKLINSYLPNLKPGEKINIVTHSHGGNVAIMALPHLDHPVDNLVTLAVPVHGDSQPETAQGKTSAHERGLAQKACIRTVPGRCRRTAQQTRRRPPFQQQVVLQPLRP